MDDSGESINYFCGLYAFPSFLSFSLPKFFFVSWFDFKMNLGSKLSVDLLGVCSEYPIIYPLWGETVFFCLSPTEE
jgi:hypothetical protein